jgi:hypothetical protein
MQIKENGRPVAGTPLMPFIKGNSVLYYNQFGGVMTGPFSGDGSFWSPYEAAALNRIAGRRAKCGNQNAPCNIGEFLSDLPAHNVFRFIDAEGAPLAGAQVNLYRAGPGEGKTAYDKIIDTTPDAQFVTDPQGSIDVGRNPFAPGQIQMCVLRISHREQVWYRFVEVSSLNLEFWRGHKDNAMYTIELPAAESAPILEVRGYEQSIDNDAMTPTLENHTDFGNVTLQPHNAADGATRAPAGITRVFVVKNRGGKPLQLQAAHLSGAHAADFFVTRQTDSDLYPGMVTTLQIRFNPQAAGLRRALVTIESNDGQTPFTFAIQGSGLQ